MALLETAAAWHRHGGAPSAAELARALDSGPDRVLPDELGRAVATLLQRHTRRLWDAGWLPEDICQITRRKASSLALSLAVDGL